MNKVTVRICGQEYVVKGEEKEDYLRKVGKEVNHLITSVMERNKQIDTSSAAVLAALNSVDRAFKKDFEIEAIKKEEGSVYQKSEGLKEEIKLLEEAMENLQKENQMLHDKISTFRNADEKGRLSKEREIKRLETELRLTQDSAKEYRDENETLSKLNKELKFELQSYKYKVLELQKKLFDTQLTQTKDNREKKEKNPILKEKLK
ncbi:cell division protein ZapA [Proteiniclasticum sp. SCR006]|uniref:Cell division protein ZapA n=1 Tax=Proteiniclasticum aestuarii TaxID=2817862 RepID=A0A939H3D1_9CLOT|nr:cell division protein ZapA [Proteiniclasticum aestuarii]MBO1263432.1 cell division protein ZapA [Proteiniclasticum aestuarii]